MKHLLIPLALALAGGAASAQNLRCGNTFADVGDAKLSVLSKCGEPALRDEYCRADPAPPMASGRPRPCVPTETWAYRPGRGQFVTILEFQDGTLREIRYGDRIP